LFIFSEEKKSSTTFWLLLVFAVILSFCLAGALGYIVHITKLRKSFSFEKEDTIVSVRFVYMVIHLLRRCEPFEEMTNKTGLTGGTTYSPPEMEAVAKELGFPSFDTFDITDVRPIDESP
jgi:hypothetical protein